MTRATTETRPCPEPGVYHGIPFAEYASWNAVNPSLAKRARKSLADFRHHELNPDTTDTDALALGRAVHACVLEPDEFMRRFVIWSGGRRYGKVWDAFCDANAGNSIINEDDFRACCKMRDSVRSHPAAAKLFTVPAEIETCLVWDDPSSGIRCKGRFDYLGERLLDLKTTARLDERSILQQVCNYGYHISMAAYHDGLYHLTGRIADPVLLFVCKSPPYECAVRPFTPEAVNRGIELWHELLGKIATARATGIYPGFADEEIPLDLPAWEMGADEDLGLTMNGEAV